MKKTCQQCGKDNPYQAVFCSGCQAHLGTPQPFLRDILWPSSYPIALPVIRDETHRRNAILALLTTLLMVFFGGCGMGWLVLPPRAVETPRQQAGSVFNNPTIVAGIEETVQAAAAELEVQQAHPTSTSVPVTTGPTNTAAPTNTPTLTITPLPTDTPSPTLTPLPTATTIPSATPIPDNVPGTVLMFEQSWRQNGLLATVSGFELLNKRCTYGDPPELWARWNVTIENQTDQVLAVDISPDDFFLRDNRGVEVIPYMVWGWNQCYYLEGGRGVVDIPFLNPGQREQIVVYARGDRTGIETIQFGIRTINDRIVVATWQHTLPR
jgi:hypothetical protein